MPSSYIGEAKVWATKTGLILHLRFDSPTGPIWRRVQLWHTMVPDNPRSGAKNPIMVQEQHELWDFIAQVVDNGPQLPSSSPQSGKAGKTDKQKARLRWLYATGQLRKRKGNNK